MIKHLLTLNDYSSLKIQEILKISRKVKKALKQGRASDALKGKTAVLIFEKPSLRTHVTFEVGIAQLGGHAVHLPGNTIKLGVRESESDVAKNLNRWVDLMVVRTFAQSRLEDLARSSSIPVINALTDSFHPCQSLAMILTLLEHVKKINGKTVCFVGDGNNVAASHMIICAKLGLNFVLTCPKGHEINPALVKKTRIEAGRNGCKVSMVRDPRLAVRKADLIYTDTWTSMGQEKEAARRKKKFAPFQVNAKLLKHAPKGVLVSHCMPAHRGEEITSDVLDGKRSIALDEAENRLHVQKGVMLYLLGKF